VGWVPRPENQDVPGERMQAGADNWGEDAVERDRTIKHWQVGRDSPKYYRKLRWTATVATLLRVDECGFQIVPDCRQGGMMRKVLCAALLLAACSGSTEPAEDPTRWAAGTWRAVEIDGQTLPIREGSAPPYVVTDSVILTVLTFGPTVAPVAGVFPYVKTVGTVTNSIVCVEGAGAAFITATTLKTSTKNGGPTSIGSCNANWAAMDLTRQGADLVGTWSNRRIRLRR
jgi:hypothetical protein